MTVKELKERLEQFPDNLTVMVMNSDYGPCLNPVFFAPATNVSRGVNENDNLLFIDDYEEEDE